MAEKNNISVKNKDKNNYKKMVSRPFSLQRIMDSLPGGRHLHPYELPGVALQRTKKAFEKNEFKKLISGARGYRISTSEFDYYYIEAGRGFLYFEPTHIDGILEFGIYELYKKTGDDKIINLFVEALEELINGEPYDVLTAIVYLFYHFDYCGMGRSPFSIDEEILKKAGAAYKNIKWNDNIKDEVERFNRIIKKETGFDMGI